MTKWRNDDDVGREKANLLFLVGADRDGLKIQMNPISTTRTSAKTIDRAQDSRHENAARRSLARENDSSTYREEDKDQMECFLLLDQQNANDAIFSLYTRSHLSEQPFPLVAPLFFRKANGICCEKNCCQSSEQL